MGTIEETGFVECIDNDVKEGSFKSKHLPFKTSESEYMDSTSEDGKAEEGEGSLC